MVPLATPARLATSSSRVAAYPRAMNSSIAAAVIAARRSAARAARPTGAPAAPSRGAAAVVAATPDAPRRLALVGLRLPCLDGRSDRVIAANMTDRSVMSRAAPNGRLSRRRDPGLDRQRSAVEFQPVDDLVDQL